MAYSFRQRDQDARLFKGGIHLASGPVVVAMSLVVNVAVMHEVPSLYMEAVRI